MTNKLANQRILRKVNKPLLKTLIRNSYGSRLAAAKAAGCSAHTVSTWMRAETTFGPREYHAQGVARFFGVSVDELFPPAQAGEQAS